MKSIKSIFLSLCIVFLPLPCLAGTILSFDSSEESWVGQGESHTVSPDDGYIFSGGQSEFDNSLSFRVASLNSPFGPNWNPGSNEEYNYWTLDLAAPFDHALDVGIYENAARYPFQNNDQPGLTFSGNHRGNNKNAGFFEVLEISFDGLGNVDSLAVDFTQYGESNKDWWINGKFRFNSDFPISAINVAEPQAIYLFLVGFAALLLTLYRRRRYS